ncbi:hypothetical protein DB88DRAFT_43731 [Papiliotrema laurentii]|jgi:serine/threonine-protein kinase RIM15|uniref:Uncharacterized protein n=1 Tax=Papiliotrema laurentii TaxID=5418 RepID=A0AAD9FWT2_PAPLA|nr:hypothetical protein DB88DRAFT_43731 [Papiliotrema laurentii]
MSGGIFYLDEDRDKDQESSPSPSPRPSPRGSPVLTASDTRPTSLSLPPSTLTASAASNASSLQIPSASPPNVFNTQPQGIARKHAAPFGATPSFPSPLAQAITVPQHSDTSSSGSRSEDDDDADAENHAGDDGPASPTQLFTRAGPSKGGDLLPRPRTASPHTSRSGSPASTQKSLSRPPSPKGSHQMIAPSTLLMRPKASTGGSLLAGSLPTPINVNRDTRASNVKASPTHPGSRRFSNVARGDQQSASPSTSTSARRRSSGSTAALNAPSSASGYSSPLAFGSPEMEPVFDREGSPNRIPRAESVSPFRERDSKDSNSANVLGLGWTSGGWDTSSTATGSSPGSSKDKGKGKDLSSGPPSPRILQRDRDRTSTPLGLAR